MSSASLPSPYLPASLRILAKLELSKTVGREDSSLRRELSRTVHGFQLLEEIPAQVDQASTEGEGELQDQWDSSPGQEGQALS